jgi:hypothetical protein
MQPGSNKKKLVNITKNKIVTLKNHNLNLILPNGIMILPHSTGNSKIFLYMSIS